MKHPPRVRKPDFMGFSLFFTLLLTLTLALSATEVLSAQDVFKTKTCNSVEISPGGEWIANTVKGYSVFYPNYRASTGYGVAFAPEGSATL